MQVPAWTLLSTRRPEPGDVALVTDPTDGAAILHGKRSHHDPAGRGEVWRWQGHDWVLIHGALFPEPRGGPSLGPPLAWTEPGVGVVLARMSEQSLVRASLSAPDVTSIVHVHGARPDMHHVFAFADPTGGAWLLAGDDGENCTITWRMQGDVAAELARGPYLVCAAFDPGTRTLVGMDVMRGVHRFVDGAWRAEPELGRHLDAMVYDPTRRAIVGLEVESDDRMALRVLGPHGWTPADPALWLPTYRNGTRLAVDVQTGLSLVFGGQDFDKRGEQSAATWFGAAGELRETSDPALPPWGRYNTLMTSPCGLLAFDHSALRLHRREPDGWRRVAAFEPEVRLDFDDRYLNVAWTDDRLLMLQSAGALIAWHPGGALAQLAPPSEQREPGGAYTRRTGLGWDPVGARPVVGSGDCGRATHVAEHGEWRELDARKFSPGDTVRTASTSAGLYALGKSNLRRLTGDEWTDVGAGLDGYAKWLGREPRRDALLAADMRGVWLATTAGWRLLLPLPDGMRFDEMGQIGVDPLRDELVAIADPQLWTTPLAALDWTDAVLPIKPFKPARPRAK